MWTLKLISVLCLFSNLFAIVPPNLTPSKDKVWNRVNGKFTNLEKLQKSNKTLLVTKQSFLEPNSDPLARYAFTYLNNRNPVAITTPATNSTNNMAVSGIGGVMSQIRDPLKHGVASAVLAGLHILALISLIVFAVTGTFAFICSFVDCRHFFLGIKPSLKRRRAELVSSPPELWNLPWPDEPNISTLSRRTRQ